MLCQNIIVDIVKIIVLNSYYQSIHILMDLIKYPFHYFNCYVSTPMYYPCNFYLIIIIIYFLIIYFSRNEKRVF